MFRSYSSTRQMAALVVRKHLSTCTVDTAPRLKRSATKYKNPRVSSDRQRKTNPVGNPNVNPTGNPTVNPTKNHIISGDTLITLSADLVYKVSKVVIGTGCAIICSYVAIDEKNYQRTTASNEKIYNELTDIRKEFAVIQKQNNKRFWQK